ncbi:hypothetical protein [Paenibacillus kandeliae]|uniref:hypothetical protein n=1 Tax=Paenibacillus kandeliae TaxID=3231269 RepID=UPI003459D9B3
MRKIMIRVLLITLLLILAGIVACFYFGYFMYAYGLIFLILAVAFGLGQLASVNNGVWMHRNGYDRHIHDQAERYRQHREED